MINNIIEQKKAEAINRNLIILAKDAYESFEGIQGLWNMSDFYKDFPYKIDKDRRSIILPDGSKIFIRSGLIKIDKNIVFEYRNSEPLIYINDLWVEPVKNFISSHKRTQNEIKLKLVKEIKSKEDKKRSYEEEVQKKNFGIEYDKKIIKDYEKVKLIESIKNSPKTIGTNLLVVLGFIIFLGSIFALIISSIIFLKWWSLITIPFGLAIIFSIFITIIDRK